MGAMDIFDDLAAEDGGSTASSPRWTTTRGDPRPARRAGASPTSCCTSRRPTRRSRPAPAPRPREAGPAMPPGSTTRPTAGARAERRAGGGLRALARRRGRHRCRALREAEPGTRLAWVATRSSPAPWPRPAWPSTGPTRWTSPVRSGRLPRHRPAAPHRLARPQHAALRLRPGRGGTATRSSAS